MDEKKLFQGIRPIMFSEIKPGVIITTANGRHLFLLDKVVEGVETKLVKLKVLYNGGLNFDKTEEHKVYKWMPFTNWILTDFSLNTAKVLYGE